MCKNNCEFNDKRLIEVNGLYCITKLKEMIKKAELSYNPILVNDNKECIICYKNILENETFHVATRTTRATNNKNEAPWINKIYCTHSKCGEIFDHHIEKFETYRRNIKIYKKIKWIKVSEKLPHGESSFYTYSKIKGILKAYNRQGHIEIYNEDGSFQVASYTDLHYYISHWILINSLMFSPEEEDKNE